MTSSCHHKSERVSLRHVPKKPASLSVWPIQGCRRSQTSNASRQRTILSIALHLRTRVRAQRPHPNKSICRSRMDISLAGAPRRPRLTSWETSAGHASNRLTCLRKSRISLNKSKNQSLTSASSLMGNKSTSSHNKELVRHRRHWTLSKTTTIAQIMNTYRFPVDSPAGSSGL